VVIATAPVAIYTWDVAFRAATVVGFFRGRGMGLYRSWPAGKIEAHSAGGLAVSGMSASEQVGGRICRPGYTLAASQPESATVQLNGQELRLGSNDELPQLRGRPVPSGTVELAPASITFLAVAGAGNGSCR
jgi:hypothetical protein